MTEELQIKNIDSNKLINIKNTEDEKSAPYTKIRDVVAESYLNLLTVVSLLENEIDITGKVSKEAIDEVICAINFMKNLLWQYTLEEERDFLVFNEKITHKEYKKSLVMYKELISILNRLQITKINKIVTQRTPDLEELFKKIITKEIKNDPLVFFVDKDEEELEQHEKMIKYYVEKFMKKDSKRLYKLLYALDQKIKLEEMKKDKELENVDVENYKINEDEENDSIEENENKTENNIIDMTDYIRGKKSGDY